MLVGFSKNFKKEQGISLKKRPVMAVFQALGAVSLFIACGTPNTEAAFELNFKPLTSGVTYQSWGDNDESANFSCNEMSFQSNTNCAYDETNDAHDDNTPMYQRIFRSTTPGETNGKYYWHVIIGDYYDQANNPANTDGLYLEYIIEANAGNRYDDHIGTAASASTTWVNPDWAEDVAGGNVYDTGTNGDWTTTGYANPKRVLVHMIMEDGETRSTFLKDGFNSKPLIEQTVYDDRITDPTTKVDNEFSMDMRSISYDTNDNTGVVIKNITNLVGDYTAADQGDYDTTDATYTPHLFNQETDNISAGKYTWASGSGNLGSDGTYTYYQVDGSVNASGFDPTDKNYTGFCDPVYNVNWSGSGACTNVGGSGGGWGSRGWD